LDRNDFHGVSRAEGPSQLTWILEKAGYSATFAQSGKAAIEIASGTPFDLAVVDVTLPDLNGVKTAIEICKRIPNCMILLMSGDTESAPLLESARKYFIKFEVLAKPIPPSELLPKLESLLANAKTCNAGLIGRNSRRRV
jgi:DNA-binding response OmpR family regulator